MSFYNFFNSSDNYKLFPDFQINCLCNVSVDDVLSLNASVISLKSENFTDGLVYNLIEKFTNRREEGSEFCIENSKKYQNKQKFAFKTIPPGFEKKFSKNGL